MKIQQQITTKLTDNFRPSHLEVVNESHMHNVPPGSESHFKVVLASESFVGQRQVQRHQQIYAVLAEELRGEVHALVLHTYAPDEWAESGKTPESPPCMGGSNKN